MNEWQSQMAGSEQMHGSRYAGRTKKYLEIGGNLVKEFLADYMNHCMTFAMMDVPLLESAIKNYTSTGENLVSVESAAWAASRFMALMCLTVVNEDGMQDFLSKQIELEKGLNEKSSTEVNEARQQHKGTRRLVQKGFLFTGCTIFSGKVFQQIADIAAQNDQVVRDCALYQKAMEVAATYKTEDRIAMGCIFSEAPYLLRALNYDTGFYCDLSDRITASWQTYQYGIVK